MRERVCMWLKAREIEEAEEVEGRIESSSNDSG